MSRRPLVIPKEEWDRINKWTEKDKRDPEAVRQREYLNYLNKRSKEMTVSWPNSVENVNKRSEELRRARIEAAEQANANFYKQYVKNQKAEQERLMYSARDMIFKNKDAPKLLLSAVIETVTLKEREEQVKFNAKIRAEAEEQKRKEDEDIIKKSKEWHELNELKRNRRFEVDKKQQKEILEQAKEIAERAKREHEEELNRQKEDIAIAQMEMETLKEYDDKLKADEKARIKAAMEQAKRDTEERRREQAELDRMNDRLQEVLLNSRARIEQKRRQTEKQIQAEKLRVLEAISQKLESGDAARDAKEQASLQKAIKEREASEEARRQAARNKIAQYNADKRAMRDKFLKEEEQRLKDLRTQAQWDLMNRFKNQEIYEDYLEKKREERQRTIFAYRDELNRLRKEREDRENRERAEIRHFYGELAESKLREADNKVFAHCVALLEEAKAHGRPTLPLEKALDRYYKHMRLYPLPNLPRGMKEHFQQYQPIDKSQPDQGYRLPLPPPHKEEDVFEDIFSTVKAGAEKRDGLQPKPQAAQKPAPPPEKKPEEAVEYKRAAPANGLQRDPAQIELPLVSVAPCCPCPRK